MYLRESADSSSLFRFIRSGALRERYRFSLFYPLLQMLNDVINLPVGVSVLLRKR